MKNKRLGILAGMGPRSTSPFLEFVYDECQKQYCAKDDIDYPEIVIYSWPTPFYTDRPVDDAALSDSIEKGLVELAKANVSVIAMPCNTAHKYFNQLEKCIKIKLLNIIEIAINRIEIDSKKITVLGTKSTIDTGIYQDSIREQGKDYVFNNEWQDRVSRIISKIKNKDDINDISKEYIEFENEIAKAGVDTIIFACTDLAVIPDRCRMLKVIDSSKELAKELIKEYLK